MLAPHQQRNLATFPFLLLLYRKAAQLPLIQINVLPKANWIPIHHGYPNNLEHNHQQSYLLNRIQKFHQVSKNDWFPSDSDFLHSVLEQYKKYSLHTPSNRSINLFNLITINIGIDGFVKMDHVQNVQKLY